MGHSGRKLELTGQRFGKLTVIAPEENVAGRTAWLCRCQCGRERVVKTYQLRSGRVTSCGHKSCGLSSLTYVDSACLEMFRAKAVRAATVPVASLVWTGGSLKDSGSETNGNRSV